MKWLLWVSVLSMVAAPLYAEAPIWKCVEPEATEYSTILCGPEAERYEPGSVNSGQVFGGAADEDRNYRQFLQRHRLEPDAAVEPEARAPEPKREESGESRSLRRFRFY